MNVMNTKDNINNNKIKTINTDNYFSENIPPPPTYV